MDTSSAIQIYEDVLKRLRSLEQTLIRHEERFDNDELSELAKAISQLKGILYTLRADDSVGDRLNLLVDDISSLSNDIDKIIRNGQRNAVSSVVMRAAQLADYYQRATDAARQKILDENDALRKRLAQLELQEETRMKEERVEKSTRRKIAKVRSAEAVREWSTYYEKHVTCEVEDDFLVAPKIKKWKPWLNRLKYWGDNFYLLERKWGQWRSVWFGSILLLSLVLGIWFTLQLSTGVSLPTIIAEKIAFLPLYVIFGIGFAFASRNYRINANLLADYRHKQIVAKVLENVIANDAFEEKDGMKLEMLQQGAKALFAPKKVGHLNKEAVEDFPVIELIKTIKKIK